MKPEQLVVVYKFDDGTVERVPYAKVRAQELRQWAALAPHDPASRARLDEVLAYELTGQTAQAQRSQAGFSSSDERRQARKPEWDRWQAEADTIHAANPRLSKSAIAQRIADKHGGTPGTIRKRITLPEK